MGALLANIAGDTNGERLQTVNLWGLESETPPWEKAAFQWFRIERC
jgi:hypothetical protein